MPLYEYECDSCGRRFERIQKFSDPPVTVCPTCGGPVRKLLSSPAIQFKGSGFYITDYARSGKGAEGDSAPKSGGDTPAEKSAPADKTDSTPATKGEKGGEAKPSSETSKPATTDKPARKTGES
jgi:putative FmdB family regulatory protein